MLTRSSIPALVLFALSSVCLSFSVAQRTKEAPPLDLAHDLGVEVRDVKPLVASIPLAARERVAAHVGCDPEELAGVQLFTGTLVTRGPAGQNGHVEDLVVVPLAGAARGGRVVFSASRGSARELGLWSALDFDEDPTLRWRVFTEQLRLAGTFETGAAVGAVSLAMAPAREVAALRAEFAAGKDADARLADALLRQRQAMRRNGIWLGMSRRGKERPPPEWLAELAAEMKELAKLSPVLEAVLGPGSAKRHAGFARDMAAVYSDMAAALKADPRADLKELQVALRPSCTGCHGETRSAGNWPEAAAESRRDLLLGDTRLHVGFDIAPTLGDHQGVSKEIADKVRAGLLLLEVVRE